MVPKGAGWYQMVSDGTEYWQMALKGAWWYQMVPDGTKWYGMVANSAEWYWMEPNGTEWCQMVPNGVRWYRMVQTGTKWCRMVPNGAEWWQMVLEYSSDRLVTFMIHSEDIQELPETFLNIQVTYKIYSGFIHELSKRHSTTSWNISKH